MLDKQSLLEALESRWRRLHAFQPGSLPRAYCKSRIENVDFVNDRFLSYHATSIDDTRRDVAMKAQHLKLVKSIEMRPVRKGKPNPAYRTRQHLTEAEVGKLLTALKQNRHGHRDWLIGLLIYRHGLRVSEACDLRWDDIDLTKRTIIVRRLKGSIDSSHYLERDELTGLKH
jgi:integrase